MAKSKGKKWTGATVAGLLAGLVLVSGVVMWGYKKATGQA